MTPIEVVDRQCQIISEQADIIRAQVTIIEQFKIAGWALDDRTEDILKNQRKNVDEGISEVEQSLKYIVAKEAIKAE